MDVKKLALSILKAETEENVIHLLNNEGLWTNLDYWKPFGANENNVSTIRNQQSKPDAAIVEKIINSVDAILIKKCAQAGIDPESQEAPGTMYEAIERFYGVKDGILSEEMRSQYASDIILAATGEKKGHVNFTLVDKGEGQSPESLTGTILSISRNNKLKINFVQGKYNMGGTGVLPFSGKNNFEVILTRKCPDMVTGKSNKWAFSIVRREGARDGRKSTMYTYLCHTDGSIFSFSAKSVNAVPKMTGGYEDLEYGAIFKLFDYDIPYKSLIGYDLRYRLNALIPGLPLPVEIRECRRQYNPEHRSILQGLFFVMSQSGEVFEEGFPLTGFFSADRQRIGYQIYLLKNLSDERIKTVKREFGQIKDTESVFFTVNGQTHGTLAKSYLNNDKIGLSYLADSLLIFLDCNGLDPAHREDLFMASRDRLMNSSFAKTVKENLATVLLENTTLLEIQNRRRQEAVKKAAKVDETITKRLQKMCSQDKLLSRLFFDGKRINDPFQLMDSVQKYVGRKHPTYFTLKSKQSQEKLPKLISMGRNFVVQFSTDASNDYFKREKEPGTIHVFLDGNPVDELIYSVSCVNGLCRLELAFPDELITGMMANYATEIEDEFVTSKFHNEFSVMVVEPVPLVNRRENESPGAKKRSKAQQRKALPNIIPVYRDQWEKYGMNEESAVIRRKTEETLDYFVNMDNKFLLTEINDLKRQEEIELKKEEYNLTMVVFAMSIETFCAEQIQDTEESMDISAEVERHTKIAARAIVPISNMIREISGRVEKAKK